MKKKELNIKNLTYLWELVGKAINGYHKRENIFCSHIEKLEWPNRVWTDKPLNEKNIQMIKEIMANDKKLIFSYFNEDANESLLKKDSHFKLQSIQYGMSLPLSHKFQINKTIDLVKVNDLASAELWSTSFYESFQYKISIETILKTQNQVQYFLTQDEKELLGTAILFVTHDVVGIHSLGIVPNKRKQGFASEVMYHILNWAIDQRLSLATLQASDMAKGMYLKMGFSLDFLMENYKLKP